MPTVLDLCGIPQVSATEGVNYGPVIHGNYSAARDFIVIQYSDEFCIRRGELELVTDKHCINISLVRRIRGWICGPVA